MTRIRTVKPEFFKHSGLFDLEQKTGLPVRLAYIGLWTCCDREGRFKWRPRELKADVLPYDNCDFSRILDELAGSAYIVKYAANGDFFGSIPSFKLHQVINHREQDSFLPEPQENQIVHASPRVKARVTARVTTRETTPAGDGLHASARVPGGREGKGRNIARVNDACMAEWVPQDYWQAFVEMRERIKAPLTAFAQKLAIKKLDAFRQQGYDPSVILGAAIQNNWKGLYIPKDDTGQPIKPQPTHVAMTWDEYNQQTGLFFDQERREWRAKEKA